MILGRPGGLLQSAGGRSAASIGPNAVVIFLWGCTSQVSEESQAVGFDHFRDWCAASDTCISNCLVCGVPGIW